MFYIVIRLFWEQCSISYMLFLYFLYIFFLFVFHPHTLIDKTDKVENWSRKKNIKNIMHTILSVTYGYLKNTEFTLV